MVLLDCHRMSGKIMLKISQDHSSSSVMGIYKLTSEMFTGYRMNEKATKTLIDTQDSNDRILYFSQSHGVEGMSIINGFFHCW